MAAPFTEHRADTGLATTLTGLLAHRGASQSSSEIVDADSRLTFADLAEVAGALAGGLRRWGVSTGDHVALLMPNCTDWIATWFAVAHLGATLVPINTRFTVAEIEYVLRQSGSQWLIHDDDVGIADDGIVSDLRHRLPNLRGVTRRGAQRSDDAATFSDLIDGPAPPPMESENQIGMIQYTSGSTAFPKGAMLRNAALIRNGYGLGVAWKMTDADRVLCANPLFHCGGSVFAFMAGFAHGASPVLMPRWSTDEAALLLARERISVVPAIDAMVRDLMSAVRLTNVRFDQLRLVAVPTDGNLIAAVADTLGCEVANVYGLTESSPNVCVGDLRDPQTVRVDAIGRPQPGIEVQIRDPAERHVLPSGAIGEIVVRGWSVMLGYFDDPTATASTIDGDGFLWTGDLGSLDDDGYLRYRGRAKQMIKSGGENVSIEEVEAQLRTHPSVADAVVVPVPDERFGEVGFAFVRTHPQSPDAIDGILAHCRGRMAGFKIPKSGLIVDDLPRVGSGKVDRVALTQRAIDHRAASPANPQ